MTDDLQGWHFDDDGTPRQGKTVELRPASDLEPNPGAPITTTATDINGRWGFSGQPPAAYDVYLTDGPTKRIWKGNTHPPFSLTNAQIAPAANVDLTKLGAGTLSDAGPADNIATNLQERLSDIIAQLKAFGG